MHHAASHTTTVQPSSQNPLIILLMMGSLFACVAKMLLLRLMAQLMPLPLTVSCFSKIQIGFTFLVPAHLGSPGKMAIKRVCVCVCVCKYL